MYTVITYMIVLISLTCLALLARILYLITQNGRTTKRSRKKSAKTIIVLGSGGHTAEMLRIVKHLNFDRYSPRIYIHARSDNISSEKVKEVELDNKDYKLISISRSREVRQSYFSSIWTTISASLNSLPIAWTENPDLILSNGPGTCVPICVIAFLFKAFFISNVKTIFIESYCRVKSLSLSGKILYYIADRVIVQWPYLRIMLEKAPLTTKSISWKSLIEESNDNVPAEIKVHLVSIIQVLMNFDGENEKSYSAEWIENSLLRLEACLDRTWETLNSGCWKDVPIQYRYSYTICSIIKSIFLEIRYETSIEDSSNKDTKSKMLVEAINQIDKGILLGAPLQSSSDLLTTIASRLNSHVISTYFTFKGSRYKGENKSPEVASKKIEIDEKDICVELFPQFLAVPHYEEPSMETFYIDIFEPKVPALLKGCMKQWKALKLWKDTDYLKRVAGMRTVPIEMGSRYTEEDWAQRLVTFSEFLETHISSKCAEIGYLAQHQLFEQIPELKEDFLVPDFCFFSDGKDDESLPDINVWFGPGGTVSPLHFDPKNNLLCQVFGYKRIILYNPEDSENLYPYETRMLCNTAQVDPYHPDYEKWPKFQKTKGYMCCLKPGEMLFIPPRWWHHVVSLSPSFSISFWWD